MKRTCIYLGTYPDWHSHLWLEVSLCRASQSITKSINQWTLHSFYFLRPTLSIMRKRLALAASVIWYTVISYTKRYLIIYDIMLLALLLDTKESFTHVKLGKRLINCTLILLLFAQGCCGQAIIPPFATESSTPPPLGY